MENWKDIPGYEGSYQVSDMGRVRSVDRCVKAKASTRTRAHTRISKGVLLNPGRNTKYGHVTVSLGRRNSINVHRLVMLAFVGPCPENKEVLHGNCDATDNRIVNLSYGTRSDNNIDSSKAGKRKLNPEKVIALRAMLEYGIPQRTVAKHFSIAPSTVAQVKKGTTWSHVK